MSSIRQNWLFKMCCSPWSVDRFNTQMRYEVHLPKKDNLDETSLRWYSNGSLIVPQGEMMNPVICSTSAHNEKWGEWDFYGKTSPKDCLVRNSYIFFSFLQIQTLSKNWQFLSFDHCLGRFGHFWERESQLLESQLPETFWSFCDSPN